MTFSTVPRLNPGDQTPPQGSRAIAARLFGVTALLLGVILALSGCVASPSEPPSTRPIPGTTGATEHLPSDAPPQKTRAQRYAEAEVSTMTTEQKAASVLMLHSPGTDAAALADFIEKYQPGGFILMGDNMPGSVSKLATVSQSVSGPARLPLLVAIDQEGGIVRRVKADKTPGAPTLRSEPPAATRKAFAQRADTLARAGVTVNFGIVADTTDDPSSFIYDRVLGTTPDAAADRVIAAVRGERGTILSTLKHFPGHGGAPGDSHTTSPVSSMSLDTWRKRELPPFRAGINAGAELLMFGHLVYAKVDDAPASLSARWHRLARDLGFDGLMITDDLLMLRGSGEAKYADGGTNAVRALEAGNDMLLYVLPADPATVDAAPSAVVSAIVSAVRDGDLDEARLDDAATRVATVRRELALGAG